MMQAIDCILRALVVAGAGAALVLSFLMLCAGERAKSGELEKDLSQ